MLSPTYKELKDIYAKYFSLGNLGTDLGNKFALLSLICYVTDKAKQKDPDATPYKIIKKILKNDSTIPENFIWALSIQCEDLMYGATEFPTFGIANKEIISTIQNLINKYLPF